MKPHLVVRRVDDFQPVWSTDRVQLWRDRPAEERFGPMGIGLMFCAVPLLLVAKPEQADTFGMLFLSVFFVAGLAVIVYGLRDALSPVPKPQSGLAEHVFGLGAFALILAVPLTFCIMANEFGTWLMACVFGIVELFLVAAIVTRVRAEWRVTRLAVKMRGPEATAPLRATADSSPTTRATPSKDRSPAKVPWTLEIYRADVLPVARSGTKPVSRASDPAGKSTKSLLYLYNFFNEEFWQGEHLAPWRRHGPVHRLESPIAAVTRARGLGDQPILDSPEEFDTAYEAAVTTFVPAGDQSLPADFREHGAFAVNTYLCSDASWRYGALRLLEVSDRILLDATGYTRSRAGLKWEIVAVVNVCRLSRVLVMVDDSTDQRALYEAFDHAFNDMDAGSPNSQRQGAIGEPRVRWVVRHEDRPDRGVAAQDTPAGRIPGRPARPATASELMSNVERYDRIHRLFED